MNGPLIWFFFAMNCQGQHTTCQSEMQTFPTQQECVDNLYHDDGRNRYLKPHAMCLPLAGEPITTKSDEAIQGQFRTKPGCIGLCGDYPTEPQRLYYKDWEK